MLSDMLQVNSSVSEGLSIDPLPLTTDPVDAEPLCENEMEPLPVLILKVTVQLTVGSWTARLFTSKSQETGTVPAGRNPLPELPSVNVSVPSVEPLPAMAIQFMLLFPPTGLSEMVAQLPVAPVPVTVQPGAVAKLPEVVIDPAVADGVEIANAASGTMARASREAF